MGTFKKYPAWTHWVKWEQIVSELTMNSPCTCWVIDPSPPLRGGFDRILVQDADSVVEEWHINFVNVACHPCWLGVRCTCREVEIEFKGCGLSDGRYTSGIHGVCIGH